MKTLLNELKRPINRRSFMKKCLTAAGAEQQWEAGSRLGFSSRGRADRQPR